MPDSDARVFCLDPKFSTTRRVIAAANAAAQNTLPAGIPIGGLRMAGYFKSASDDAPLVSIVTPVLNCGRYLEDTIKSILDQTYGNIEYLIVDGGSRDGTLDIVRRYDHYIDYWSSGADGSQSEAINKGLRLTRGDIVLWLNGDDLLTPHAVATAVEHMQSTRAAFTYGHSDLIDANGDVFQHLYSCRQNLRSYQVDGGNVFQGTVYMSRGAWERHGPLDVSMKCAFEYKLFDNLLRHERGVFINRSLAQYRIHAEAISSRFADRYAIELATFRPERANALVRSFYRARRLALNAINGNLLPKLATTWSVRSGIS